MTENTSLIDAIYAELTKPGEQLREDSSTPEGFHSKIYYPDGSDLFEVIYVNKNTRRTFLIDPDTFRLGKKGEGSAYVPGHKKRVTLRKRYIENLNELFKVIPKDQIPLLINNDQKQNEDRKNEKKESGDVIF